MYLVTASEMQRMDKKTIQSFGLPGRLLMENAGRGATDIFMKTFGRPGSKKIGIMAGRGNNGGDGFVMARYLAQKGLNVSVFLLARRTQLKGDAAENFKLLAPLQIPVHEMPDQAAFSRRRAAIGRMDLWIDAILGTGLNSEVKGFFKAVIDSLNRLGKPTLAVDIPSGLNADTAQPCGTCIRAHTTATFAFAKIGHVLYPGAEYTGKLEVIDIGVPPHVAAEVGPRQFLLTTEDIRGCLKSRLPDTHKGHTGHLLVLAGSPGKTGAAAMTAMSAMRSGAGLVTLGIPANLNPVLETQVLEAMTCPLPQTPTGEFAVSAWGEIKKRLIGKKCLAMGPGIGTAEETKALVLKILKGCRIPVVIDADGLNCLAGHTQHFLKCKGPVVITPHPGEMARLMRTTAGRVQEDRIKNAREFAQRHLVHVVLKGARTVIAHPDGSVFVNPTGNPGMASGGMGDVLTGVIAGLIAQGYSPDVSAHVGTYLHGAAADALLQKHRPFGFIASDVMDNLPLEIGKLTAIPDLS